MRKISVLFLSFIALVAIFTSCNPVTESPEISVTPTSDTVYYVATKAGTDVTFQVTMKPDEANSVTLTTLTWTDGGTLNESLDLGGAAAEITKEVKITVSDEIKSDTTITITFEVMDDAENGKTATAKIYVMEEPVTVTVLSFNTINLNSDNSTVANCNAMIDAQTGDVRNIQYTPADELDLAFVYHGAGGNVIASPDASYCETKWNINGNLYSAAGKNSTKIQQVSISSLDDVTVEYLQDLTVSSENILGTASFGVGTQIEIGDFVAFETTDGYKGVIEIKTMQWANPKAPTVAGSMTCDMRVLSEATAGK